MLNKSSLDIFLLEDELTINEGKSGLPQIKIDNKYGSALISIYGAQLLSYKTKMNQENELLFVSESAYFEEGKAIKGGIPICWPWFGRDPENLGRQMHGFARNMLWQIEETESINDEGTKVVLSLSESDESYKLWPHDFKVILTINVGKTLRLSLQTVNTGNKAFSITQALHAYFGVEDIGQTQVAGLDGVKYIDTVNGANKSEMQEGSISVNQEIDRIYTDVPNRTVLIDQKSKREVVIDSSGSKTTVVWNPWIAISKSSGDLNDDAYKRFICIETANAAEDVVVIEPSDSFTIEAEYKVNVYSVL
ncbi:MAG: D-hexose-6-phosphate mutarotase [Cocleimonas sp.]